MKKIKKPTTKQVSSTLHVVLAVAFIALGIAGTIAVQNKINSFKAQGVAEYKSLYCQEYHKKYEDNSVAKWLECEI